MGLVTTNEMLKDAMANNYAIAAFNIENMEMAQGVISAAVKTESPVIIATSQSSLKYAEPEVYFGFIYAMAQKVSIPIALHLDHSKSIELILKVLKAGYTSVMIDGSQLNYNENINITKETKKFCDIFDIPVEAELGVILGKKTDTTTQIMLTKPETAVDFIEKTNCNSLAVSIGNKHGLYKSKPNLDFERLKQIRSQVPIPLVLHGSSDIPDEDIRKCVKLGINKFNFATELRCAFTSAMDKYIKDNTNAIDPREYLAVARDAVEEICIEKIKLIGK